MVDAPHAARQGSGRHARRGADGAEDAGTARAARRLRGVLSRLLPDPHELSLLAVAVRRAGDAGRRVGVDDGTGPGAHAGGPAGAATGRAAGRAHRDAGCPHHGAAVRAVPAHRAAVGPAARCDVGHRAVGHPAHGLRDRARRRRQHCLSRALRGPRAATAGDVLSRPGARQFRWPRMDAGAADIDGRLPAAHAGSARRPRALRDDARAVAAANTAAAGGHRRRAADRGLPRARRQRPAMAHAPPHHRAAALHRRGASGVQSRARARVAGVARLPRTATRRQPAHRRVGTGLATTAGADKRRCRHAGTRGAAAHPQQRLRLHPDPRCVRRTGQSRDRHSTSSGSTASSASASTYAAASSWS